MIFTEFEYIINAKLPLNPEEVKGHGGLSSLRAVGVPVCFAVTLVNCDDSWTEIANQSADKPLPYDGTKDYWKLYQKGMASVLAPISAHNAKHGTTPRFNTRQEFLKHAQKVGKSKTGVSANK